MKNNFNVIYKGFLIGSTMLVPGVSGGSMAMILGIYERLLASVSSFSRDKKGNSAFLLLFIGGAGIGMLLLAKPLLGLLESYPTPMQCFLIGAVAGGIPAILKQAQIQKVAGKHILYLAAGFLLVLGISFFPSEIFLAGIAAEGGNMTSENGNMLNYTFLLLAGIIAATALVLPGISVSYFLLVLGLYHELMRAISEFDLKFLLPMGIGIVIGVLLVTKTLELVLKKYPQVAYMTILGFVIGSVIEILPKCPQGMEWLFSIAAVLLGFFFISTLSEVEEK